MAKSKAKKKTGTSNSWVLRKGQIPVRFDVSKDVIKQKDGRIIHKWDWICEEGDKRWKTRAEWLMENESVRST